MALRRRLAEGEFDSCHLGLAKSGIKDSRAVEIDHGFADGRIFATIGGVAPDEYVDQALLAVKRLTKRN